MSLKRSSTTQPGNMTFSRGGPDEQQAEAVHHQQGGRNPAQAEAVRRLLDGRQADGGRHFQEDERRPPNSPRTDLVFPWDSQPQARVEREPVDQARVERHQLQQQRAETVRRLLDGRLAGEKEQANALHHQPGLRAGQSTAGGHRSYPNSATAGPNARAQRAERRSQRVTEPSASARRTSPLNSSAQKAATGVFQEAKQEDRTRPPISGTEQADRGSTSSLARSMEQQGQDASSRDPRVRISYVSPRSPSSPLHPDEHDESSRQPFKGTPREIFFPAGAGQTGRAPPPSSPLRPREDSPTGPVRTKLGPPGKFFFKLGSTALCLRMRVTEDARTRLLSRLRTSCTQLLARSPRTLTSIGKNGPRPNGP